MEAQGLIRRSFSSWGSPLHLVPKPDGTWRPCGDYRLLNSRTVKDRYTLPLLRDFAANMSGSKVFSVIDLKKAYYQVPLSKSSIPKTAIITPFGNFEFVVMPYGVCNAAPTFQRLMDSIFAGVPFVFIYLDDLIIFSPNEQSHEEHLRHVLQLLRNHGLAVNRDKCQMFRREVSYKGNMSY